MKYLAYTVSIAGLVASLGGAALAQDETDTAPDPETVTCADFVTLSADEQRDVLDQLKASDSSTDTEADAGADMGADADAGADTDTGADMSTDTDTDTGGDVTTMEGDAGADTDLSADAGADADTDADIEAVISACEGDATALVSDVAP
ncbi:HdeA/HdeB family chaperone [Pontibaca methylaminivorans]|uniref:HdeA/HdeB family protein n=1 Tax=Pontibaca methylaminivorans TaxID=515897 RepID=A0A1R3WR38_9RHOB|nr:HdeA/HdeB family chaperone [Pontibaca methylaminivorans]SIT80726.1 HdeA/HdeB family protein [Pontibaca methylaminivorans]